MTGYDLSQWPLFRSLIAGASEDARKPQQCFVVGPFDSEDAAVRDHAAAVLKYVVRPALLDTEYAPFRIESLESEDRIGKSTVDALLADPVCIVIASGRSFSVDYALNVSQAMKRPTVVLVEAGATPSVSVVGAQVATYSFQPEALLGGANIANLQEALEAALQGTAAAPAEVRAVAAPAAAATPPAPKGPQPFNDEQRVALIRAAGKRVDVMGLANLPLALRPDLRAFLCSESAIGLELRVLQCAPSNAGLPTIVGARDMQQLAIVQGEIEAAAEAWRRLAEDPACQASLILRRTQTSVPLSNAVITDKAMAATPYLFSRAGGDGPTYVADAGAAEHAAMVEEFTALWGEAAAFFRSEPRAAAAQPPQYASQASAPAQSAPPARSAPLAQSAPPMQSAPPPQSAPPQSAHPLSAGFEPVQRVKVDTVAPPAASTPPTASAPPNPSPPESQPAAAAKPQEEPPRAGAVIPPTSSGLLKGFSSLRGVTSN